VKPRVAVALLSMIVASAASGACGSGQVHVFGAFPYDAANDCLEPAQTLDVIDGPDPGMCPVVRCWLDPTGAAFVTDEACDAPINLAESVSGNCAPALEAFKKRVMCPIGDAGADGS
jgi:hypothetical protein